MFGADETQVQVRGVDVSDHGASGGDGLATGGAHRPSPAVADVDRGDRCVAAKLAAGAFEPGDESVGQPAGATFGDREPDLLAEHGQKPPVDTTYRRFGYQVGVQGVAAEEQPAAGPVEMFLRHAAHGKHGETGEAQYLRRTA